MCLSTAYKNAIAPENILMQNVVSVEMVEGKIRLTDLMERVKEFPATLKIAALTDGYLILAMKEE